MEHLRCLVKGIKYHNPEDGFTVLICTARGHKDTVAVVGKLPVVRVDEEIDVGGDWKTGKYGLYFAVKTFEEILPATIHGIEKYLSGGFIKGIGPKYARRIVETFGLETLKIMEENPERLAEVPGIGKSKIDSIKENWTTQKEIQNIMVFLHGYDISTGMAVKIYKLYGQESVPKLQENPYRLADDLWGVGFLTADKVAHKMGIDDERDIRLMSGLLYTLNQMSDEGHCYATLEQLMEKGEKILQVDKKLLLNALDHMVREKKIIAEKYVDNDDIALYLPVFYYSECGAAKKLVDIFSEPKIDGLNSEDMPRLFTGCGGTKYNETQRKAILTALKSKVMILTGGPGTGKTTTTKGIIEAFKQKDSTILLAAPTGRAAKRLSEATGCEAKTIHRMLEMKPGEGYKRNEHNPLKGDVLIVDECSMIDVVLMYSLLKAVPLTMTLIFVGDIDQLPSVGAGNVLRDIIDSACFPVVRLTQIFRQAQASRIIMNAHRVNNGVMPDISNGANSDFFFMEREEPEVIAQTITELVQTRLPKHYNVEPYDIQVLTPMQKSLIGAANLNTMLQAALNPNGTGIRRGAYMFRPGDKVMQIRNNYEKQVYNGDIGMVERLIDVDGSPVLTVRFDNHPIEYEVYELEELVLAYATTIHKSQGSEYPVVVMPVSMSHFIMLQRNLIYTGITRAKKALVIVGTKKALRYAVRNLTVSLRNTRLKERLREYTRQRDENGRKNFNLSIVPPSPQQEF